MSVQPQDIRLFLGYFFGALFAVAGIWLVKAAVKERNTTLSISSDGPFIRHEVLFLGPNL
jgi:hypothetical protein